MRLSRASVGRFSLYLRCVQRLHEEGSRTISSSQLGEALGITDTQVRKDLAYLGNLGHRGVGYPTTELISALRAVLEHFTVHWEAGDPPADVAGLFLRPAHAAFLEPEVVVVAVDCVVSASERPQPGWLSVPDGGAPCNDEASLVTVR